MKLTKEQKDEVLSVLNEMRKNAENKYAYMKEYANTDPKIDRKILDRLFSEATKDIDKFIEKVENDENFELSTNSWRAVFAFEIARTKRQEDLMAINSLKNGFGGSIGENYD